ncbi:TetR/AcrR family transcriptional regulator [Microtetraspora niveoalba]|uniref:TetR/AcrR family transcriptional regulator n=1 Tax=Microtetraspora niveoalba TaxID=46175 RepID=UPI00082B6E11|nr:TetR/AcrR family transcriptional regulator [Microtetraspora niveoalba]
MTPPRPTRPARRADAERNIAAIVTAGLDLLTKDPDASTADIAKAAGVGRVTLYGHFPTREALVEAVLDRAVALVDAALEDPAYEELPAQEAISRLIASSWELLDRNRRLLTAADRVLPTERIRHYHEGALSRVERLIARGRDEGAFRTDLPLSWLVAHVYATLHSAAQEVEAGRLDHADAARVLDATLRSVLAAGR